MRSGLPVTALLHHAVSRNYHSGCPVRDAAEYASIEIKKRRLRRRLSPVDVPPQLMQIMR